MTPLPGNPSDAGPLEPRRDPCEDYQPCGVCRNTTRTRDLWTCQGAVPDLCTHRACEGCKVTCWSCGLTVCEEHAYEVEGEAGRCCANCLRIGLESGELKPEAIRKLDNVRGVRFNRLVK